MDTVSRDTLNRVFSFKDLDGYCFKRHSYRRVNSFEDLDGICIKRHS